MISKRSLGLLGAVGAVGAVGALDSVGAVGAVGAVGGLTAHLSLTSAAFSSRSCTHVVMEATGVYWKPVWHVLEE